MRLAYILMHAELEAVVCSGAPRGKQQTYALFDERVPPAKPLHRDEALAELTARYFTSRGPGDREGLRAVVQPHRRRRESRPRDGRAAAPARGDRRPDVLVGSVVRGTRPTSPMVDLVQGYDECIMSYSESKRRPAGAGGER